MPSPSRVVADKERVSLPALWMALNNGFRWRMVLRMAAGEELTAPQAARGSDLRMSTVRKHLGQLRKLGVIDSRPGPDKRSEVFFLRASRRPEPGVLEFGACRIVLADPPQPLTPTG